TISEFIMTFMQCVFIKYKGIRIIDWEQFKIKNMITNFKNLLRH
ncbi:flippase, partial [Escherichia coli]|nr:flippase [Escherichia coli]